MSMPVKVFICAVPFLTSFALVYVLLYPAFTESAFKASELMTRKNEAEQLRRKLKDKIKAEADKESLEEQLRLLRGQVPKTPELDLVLLDLERLCSQSGADLIAFEAPESEVMRSMKASEKEAKDVMAQTGGKLSLGSKTFKKSQEVKSKELTDDSDTMLKRLLKQVYVTGDYGRIIELMKRLEAYERVLGISQITVALPKEGSEGERDPASERAKKLALKQPMLSFLMSVYYLP